MGPVAASSAISQIGQLQDVNRSSSIGGSSSSAVKPAGTPGLGGFAELISDYVRQTNINQQVSDSAIESFATGQTDNVQQVVLAMAKAEMSFQMFMEIRNKLIDSYNELMRMQF